MKKITLSTTPPTKGSKSWQLWTDSGDIAKEALDSDFIKGIGSGTLDPDEYGHYTIQDSAYCTHAQNDYRTIEKRATTEGYTDLAAFAQARYESYLTYTNQVIKDWHLASTAAIVPGPAAQAYINFEHYVANDLPPIYGVIAMIPCDQLWPWLATSLQADIRPGNLYDFWIKNNADWHGAYRLDNFVDSWFQANPEVYDEVTALYVFQSCMTGEVNFFRSATKQPLLPMPEKPSSL